MSTRTNACATAKIVHTAHLSVSRLFFVVEVEAEVRAHPQAARYVCITRRGENASRNADRILRSGRAASKKTPSPDRAGCGAATGAPSRSCIAGIGDRERPSVLDTLAVVYASPSLAILRPAATSLHPPVPHHLIAPRPCFQSFIPKCVAKR